MPKYSFEILVHFTCNSCGKWWSIGDAPIGYNREWFCPWCGSKDSATNILGSKPADNFIQDGLSLAREIYEHNAKI